MIEVSVRPRSPFRLPGGGMDGVMRTGGGAIARLLHVNDAPVVVCAWQRADGRIGIRAEPVDPARVRPRAERRASEPDLELALERMRFAIGVDEDTREFLEAFRDDELLGPAIRNVPWARPRRRPWPWEALAWAITAQLIEAQHAAEIQHAIVVRFGPAYTPAGRRTTLRDLPGPERVRDIAPAELTALDLAPKRALAMIRVAREVASRRVDLGDPNSDPRLMAIPDIGPWTLQCLGSDGRAEQDALPAGDLAYVKLVGHLAALGRRATVPEVEEFFAPYAPFRALAGIVALKHFGHELKGAPPLKLAA